MIVAAAALAAAAARSPLPAATRPTATGPATAPATAPAILFNTNFEGGSVGRIEAVGPTAYRVHVAGQHDERGHNRQASWFYFRMDRVRGRAVTLTLTDFVGEYDDKPGAVPAGPDILPVYSADGGRTWRHFADGAWDDEKKEMTVTVRPDGDADSVLVAHVPPYTPADLDRLLADLRQSPHAVVEVVGKTAGGRDMHQVTVTDPDVPDAGKAALWVVAREHAWEAGTSYVAEGALRFLTSDDPAAADLRRRAVFRVLPMVDVDGAAAGRVRFNANGFDVNRHWDEVDLRRPEFLRQMPEIWYAKKAIVAAALAGRGDGARPGVDLVVNLHNTETAEYAEAHARGAGPAAAVRRLADLLAAGPRFDPSRPVVVRDGPVGTTSALSAEYGIPVVLLEQRIAPGKKLGRRPTVEDRRAFGRDLVTAMAAAVQ